MDGSTYYATLVEKMPPIGSIAGAATVPRCDDGNGAVEEQGPLTAHHIYGAETDLAIVVPDLSETTVYVAKSATPADLPPEIRELLGR